MTPGAKAHGPVDLLWPSYQCAIIRHTRWVRKRVRPLGIQQSHKENNVSDNIFADLVEIANGNVAAAAFHVKELSDLADEAKDRTAVSQVGALALVDKLQRAVRRLTWCMAANLVLTTMCLIKVCLG